jgi:ankyrin repeat protein
VESRAIVRAIEAGDLSTADRLCRAHREQLLASGELNYLFKYAAGADCVPALGLLLTAGAEVNAPLDEYTEQTALYSATANGAAESVRWLLAHGAVVNQEVEGERRCLPLFVAIRLGHASIVRQLVEAGAVTRTVWNGQTPAECATAHGYPEVARYLVSVAEAEPSDPADTSRDVGSPDS